MHRPHPSGTLKGSQLGLNRANLHGFRSSTAAMLFGGHFHLVETIKKSHRWGFTAGFGTAFIKKLLALLTFMLHLFV